ncbi:hypothetical protein FHR81_002035 [Actinoalloteichus hoggarensis]|uniref:Uncharacterized protein n=1 Tax=Actinoalloteichus hoggarensis TaxID=1470176 RepID=A0A221W5V1_9PSEU|nr:hypothetical protein [Actinoalloteichus hoggarensis]ASO21066.1 hypothetical protein AHOG_17205 [Actinoalloteichus hoggarensis]MBB5920997.1 hypothetical protein [Actinoalloteichus hoggarensis]
MRRDDLLLFRSKIKPLHAAINAKDMKTAQKIIDYLLREASSPAAMIEVLEEMHLRVKGRPFDGKK